MKKIAVAHQLHHAEKYGGAPWGMFLGPLVSQRLGAPGLVYVQHLMDGVS